eukprot:403653-Rhodomonas_salina.2
MVLWYPVLFYRMVLCGIRSDRLWYCAMPVQNSRKGYARSSISVLCYALPVMTSCTYGATRADAIAQRAGDG